MSSQGNPRRRRIAGERRHPDQAGETSTTPLTPAPLPAEPKTVKPPRSPKPPRTGNPWPLFAAAAALALVLVVTALGLGLQVWSYGDVRTQDQVEKAEESASATAERAATAILSFTYTTLDADLQASTRFMTPKFADTFTGTFDSLARPNALKTKATVTAKVLATAVINASESRAEILVYVDQTTVSTANSGNPSVALNRTSFDLVKVDGSWLVDDFHSY